MTSIVYRITQLATGRFYIGVHDLPEGWADPNEDDGYWGSGAWIKSAVRKHGRSAFKKEVLAVFETKEEALERERILVGPEQVADPMCFNLCEGGAGGLHALSDEAKARRVAGITANVRKRCITDEWREQCSRIVKARFESDPGYREKMAQAAASSVKRPEVRKRISESVRSRYQRPGELEKVSRISKTTWDNASEAQRASHSASVREGMRLAGAGAVSTATNHKRFSDPKQRQNTSKKSKAWWSNATPEQRSAHAEAVRRGMMMKKAQEAK